MTVPRRVVDMFADELRADVLSRYSLPLWLGVKLGDWRPLDDEADGSWRLCVHDWVALFWRMHNGGGGPKWAELR